MHIMAFFGCGTCSCFPMQEMTITWCLRRAELVFKSIKGEEMREREREREVRKEEKEGGN